MTNWTPIFEMMVKDLRAMEIYMVVANQGARSFEADFITDYSNANVEKKVASYFEKWDTMVLHRMVKNGSPRFHVTTKNHDVLIDITIHKMDI